MSVGENRNWLNNSMFNTVFSNICSPYTEQTPSGLPNPTPVERHVRFFQATGMSSRAVACAFNSCHSTSLSFQDNVNKYVFSTEDYVRKSHSDTS